MKLPTKLFLCALFGTTVRTTQGKCKGTPTSACSTLFVPRTCSSCNHNDCIDDLQICDAACTQPGCGCQIFDGICDSTNPTSSPSYVRCLGSPTSCEDLATIKSCQLVDGCIWEQETGEDDDVDGTCVGSGISTCSAQFPNTPCSTLTCTPTYNTCLALCSHPGCSCSPFGQNPVRCEGIPLKCSMFATKSLCSQASNCAWIPGTSTPSDPGSGVCTGTAITDCSVQYDDFSFLPGHYIPIEEYTTCTEDCKHPGCGCKIIPGVTNVGPIYVGGYSTLSCHGTPAACGSLINAEACGIAQGCIWTLSQVPENPEDCDLDMQVSCKTDDGKDCSSRLPPSSNQCARKRSLYTLFFTYQATGCGTHSNSQGSQASCEDLGTLSKSGEVGIVCLDADNNAVQMHVMPSRLSPGGYFSVSNKRVGELPTRIRCAIISTTENQVFQQIEFDTSGNVDLDLKDRFGAMQVEGCDSKKCFEDWSYRTSVRNTNNKTDAILLKLDLNLNFTSNSVDLLEGIANTDKVIAPNAVFNVSERLRVDLCGEPNLGAQASAVMTSDNHLAGCGPVSNNLEISNNVGCKLQTSVSCTGTGDRARNLEGVDCRAVRQETATRCRCGSCARELRLRYTGNMCGKNFPGFTCQNVTTPTSSARAIARYRSTNIAEIKKMDIGEDFIITNGGQCLPETFSVLVTPYRQSDVTQTFTITTGCSGTQGLRMLGSYGAFDFVGYSCNELNVHNCFLDVEEEVCVDNGGTRTRTLERMELEVEVDGTPVDHSPFDMLNGTSPKLLPGSTFCKSRKEEIELCANKSYKLVGSAQVNKDTCTDHTSYSDYDFPGTASATTEPPPQDTEGEEEGDNDPEVTSIPPECLTGPVSVFDSRPKGCP